MANRAVVGALGLGLAGLSAHSWLTKRRAEQEQERAEREAEARLAAFEAELNAVNLNSASSRIHQVATSYRLSLKLRAQLLRELSRWALKRRTHARGFVLPLVRATTSMRASEAVLAVGLNVVVEPEVLTGVLEDSDIALGLSV